MGDLDVSKDTSSKTGKILNKIKGILSIEAMPIVITILGLYLSHIYQEERMRVTKMEFEKSILQMVVTGKEDEKIWLCLR